MTKSNLPYRGDSVATNPAGERGRLWAFAVRLYAAPGVEAACLRLQDEAGLDVAMLLFCVWAGLRGPGRLADAEMTAALASARGWGAVAADLRSARRALKSPDLGADAPRLALRQTVAGAEREAERIALDLLEASCSGIEVRDPGAAAAWANLARYCGANARAEDDLKILMERAAALPAD